MFSDWLICPRLRILASSLNSAADPSIVFQVFAATEFRREDRGWESLLDLPLQITLTNY